MCVCDREAAEREEEEEEEERDTESRTRTPRKDMGKKHDSLSQVAEWDEEVSV